jgi:hypothetical protein
MPAFSESLHARLCYFDVCPRLGRKACDAERCKHKCCVEHIEQCLYCRESFCGDHLEQHIADCPVPDGVALYPANDGVGR